MSVPSHSGKYAALCFSLYRSRVHLPAVHFIVGTSCPSFHILMHNPVFSRWDVWQLYSKGNHKVARSPFFGHQWTRVGTISHRSWSYSLVTTWCANAESVPGWVSTCDYFKTLFKCKSFLLSNFGHSECYYSKKKIKAQQIIWIIHARITQAFSFSWILVIQDKAIEGFRRNALFFYYASKCPS